MRHARISKDGEEKLEARCGFGCAILLLCICCACCIFSDCTHGDVCM